MKSMVKWFWGLNQDPDEAQAQVLANLSTQVLMAAVVTNVVVLLAAYSWDIMHHQLSVPTILIVFMLIIISGYSSALTKTVLGKYATTQEVATPAAYQAIIKHLQVKAIFQSILFFGIYSLLFVGGTDYLLAENPGWMDLISCLVATVLFGGIMYGIQRSKIKRTY